MPRKTSNARQTRSVIDRLGRSGNTAGRLSMEESIAPIHNWDRKVWGVTPRHFLNQDGLTRLFDEQKRLKAVLLKQSRLAKLAVSELRSTEVELLRRINEQIAHGFVTSGEDNIFSARDLTPAQLRAESMLRRQGKRRITGTNDKAPSPGRMKGPSLRRALHMTQGQKFSAVCAPSEEIGSLRGVLCSSFRRARIRGYRGPPSRWLKGPAAHKCILVLRQKGLVSPLWSGELSVFDPHSPLHYVKFRNADVHHGFHGERLYRERSDPLILVRQAHSVPRLSKKEWPRDSRGRSAWPTYPTLHESWVQMLKGQSRRRLSIPDTLLESRKIPSNQVKPGMAVRTITHHVRGIRADTVVPSQYLAYFKYRWGFLILRRNHQLPNGLVRFLTSVWKADITKMFLVCPIRYNDALRRMPAKRFYLLTGFVSATPSSDGRSSRRRLQRIRRRIMSSNVPLDVHDTSSESERGVRLC